MQSIVDAPWDSLTTKDYLDTHLARVGAHFAQIDARFAQIDARFAQVDARFDTVEARINATIAQSLRKQTIWLMSAMFAFNGLLAAWITAFH